MRARGDALPLSLGLSFIFITTRAYRPGSPTYMYNIYMCLLRLEWIWRDSRFLRGVKLKKKCVTIAVIHASSKNIRLVVIAKKKKNSASKNRPYIWSTKNTSKKQSRSLFFFTMLSRVYIHTYRESSFYKEIRLWRHTCEIATSPSRLDKYI